MTHSSEPATPGKPRLAHPGEQRQPLDSGQSRTLSSLKRARPSLAAANTAPADSDLLGLSELDAVIECSAEPSALAGVDGSPDYVIQSNLVGAYHCLELARRHGAALVFLSTSRVYPIAALGGLALQEDEARFGSPPFSRTPAPRRPESPRIPRSPAPGRSMGRQSWRPSC